MDGEQYGAKIVQAYREHRPYLTDLAFRMLGDIGAAEDAVQDAFTRLMRSNYGEIEDERGWLTVVTSRLCLDRIRSAWSRRESAHDASEIEFVAPPAQHSLADPADRVTFDDGCPTRLAGSPRCLPSAAGRCPACSCSPCAASSSRRSMSSVIRTS
jgi:RNA polymerase sigma-70 factor, ECF subfamily